MSTLPRARIRIAADLFRFDDFTDTLRSDDPEFIPKLRAGDDSQFEIALFNNGALLNDLSGISSIHLEIKPLHAEPEPAFDLDDYEEFDLRGPAPNVEPIREKTIAAEDLNAALTLTEWDSLAADKAHAIITLDAAETNLAPGDRWLTLAVTTNDAPAQTRTIAAGRLRIFGGGRSQGQPPETPAVQYYSAAQSDNRFARQSENLADLSDAESARENLGLGSAATLDAIDEDDFASQSDQHLPTQQSVKAYVDAAVVGANGGTPSPRHGVRFDGTAGCIELGDQFDQDMSAGWSLCGWLRTSAAAGVIIRKGSGTAFYQLAVVGGALEASLEDGSSSASVTGPSINDNLWHSFVLSVDPAATDGLKLYVDGQLAGSSDPTALGSLSNSDSLFIGASNGASGFFTGTLSDFGFVSTTLSAIDVELIRSDGLLAFVAEHPGDVEIALPLDDGIGYQVHDHSGHHRDGLLSASGASHLAPRASGFIRELNLDAYNGGAGGVEMLSSTRDILPAYAWVTRAVVVNGGSDPVSVLDIDRSNRSTTSACLELSNTLSGGGQLAQVLPAQPTTNQQLQSRRNISLSSTDADATDLSVVVEYSVFQP